MFDYSVVQNGIGLVNLDPPSPDMLHTVKISYKKKEILKIKLHPDEQISFVIDGFEFNISSLLVSEKYRYETVMKITSKPSEAYKLLNVSKRTFYRKINQYGIKSHNNSK